MLASLSPGNRRTDCHRAGVVTMPAAAPSGVAFTHRRVPDVPPREHAMGDKSPHESHTKKPAVKSIKEKRLEKKAKTEHAPSQMETVVHAKRH
jgi:hypothetical protein